MNGWRTNLTRGVLALGTLTVGGLPLAPGAVADDGADLTGVPAPIVIETAGGAHVGVDTDTAGGTGIDVNDPALVAELTEVHESFDPGDGWVLPGRSPFALAQASAGAGITVTFDGAHTAPPNVQAVVLAAANDWNQVLATSISGPVEIAVIWKNLGSPSLLGSAGPTGLYTGHSLPTDSYYPAALANTLLNTDVNGAGAELTVNLNSTPNWYIGTGGSPGGGQIDLYSVVLHEMAHGLGFIGSGSLYNGGGSGPTLDHPTFVFDRLVTHNGTPLLNLGDPNAVLTSNNLRIGISTALDTKLYAPGGWQEGSSFSHFDEAAHPSGTAGALMTPSLGSQQVERELDAKVVGVMRRIGWPMKVGPVAPTGLTVGSAGTSVTAGWGVNFDGVGPAPDTVRVEAWRNGTTLDASTTVAATVASATLTNLVGGSSYTIRATASAGGLDGPGATASLTITGVPAAPATIALAPGTGLTRTLTWSPPGGPVSSYLVERSTDGIGWSTVGTTSSTSIGVSFPAEGVHQLRVRATNGYGAGPFGYSIPTGVGAGIVRPVALDGQVGRIYRAYFSRSPDPAGFGYWQGVRSAGLPMSSVSATFAASAEFAATYGQVNDAAFVDLVYQNVMGRPADASGQAYWTGQLAQGVSRGAVMLAFAESQEFVASTGTVAPRAATDDEVYRLYVAFFLRQPDAGGFAYWVGVRNGGASLETIAASFVASAEFAATYGSVADDRFVQLVYNNVLARHPDPTGDGYWRSQLAAGLSRGAVMVAFSESAEFVVATGTLP